MDILVDGDTRSDIDIGGHSWFSYVAERIPGVVERPKSQRHLVWDRNCGPGDILFEVGESRPQFIIKDEMTPPAIEYDAVWKVAQRYTRRPVKLGGISAQLLETMLVDAHYRNRRDVVMSLSAMMNAEYHRLADAGCAIIQVEEPSIYQTLDTADETGLTADFLVEAFNVEVKGLREKTEVWCHTCWGNPAAQSVMSGDERYTASLPYFNKFDVDAITFETAANGGRDLVDIAKIIDPEKKIAIGVVNHRLLQVERPEQVAALVRRAIEFIDPSRLILTSDCGFGRQGMSRIHAFHKMASIARGANIVREELGFPTRPIPAVDPTFA